MDKPITKKDLEPIYDTLDEHTRALTAIESKVDTLTENVNRLLENDYLARRVERIAHAMREFHNIDL